MLAARLVSRGLVVGATLALVAACGDPEVIVPETLGIVTILPTHGAADVQNDVVSYVYFSHSVADASAAARAINLECLGGAPCTNPVTSTCVAPSVTVAFEDAGNQVASLTSSTALLDDTCYAIVVSAGIEAADSNVGPLPVDIRSAFKTRE